MLQRLLPLLISGIVVASAPTGADQKNTSTAPDVVAGAVESCLELKFPNSMARPKGFDINAHLAKVEKSYRHLIAKLANPDGLKQIDSYLGSQRDDVEVLCAVEIAGETNLKAAVPLLQRYVESPIYGVSDKAKSYLAVLGKK